MDDKPKMLPWAIDPIRYAGLAQLIVVFVSARLALFSHLAYKNSRSGPNAAAPSGEIAQMPLRIFCTEQLLWATFLFHQPV